MVARRIGAAILGWVSPAFKGWALLRACELVRKGESATIVIWFNKQAFDADELERMGEPEFAVRRANGKIERSPIVAPPRPALRLVQRRHG